MREMARLGFILMAMSLLCAAALGFVNGRTEGLIAAQKELARVEAMNAVSASLGDSLSFDSLAVPGLVNPYPETGRELAVVEILRDGRRVGYIFTAYRKGYSSTIETLVALDTAGVIAGSTILYQSETPGLGTRYAAPEWLGQLSGRDGSSVLLERDGGEISAVTGATVSGRAITGSVVDGVDALRAAGLFAAGGVN
jgi:electron transport complex protein RnfG